jgi:Zn-dependent proteases
MLLTIFGNSWQYYAMVIPAVLLCITFHEYCHGLVAYWLGDQTAKEAGRLTLNPLKHLDPIGALCMVVAGVGWAKPVPIDPRRMCKIKNRKVAVSLTALAGPVSNMILAFFLFFIYLEITIHFTNGFMPALGEFLHITAYLSVGLAAFNLLPIPPLDGSKILFPLLPNKLIGTVAKYERYLSLAFLALIMLGVLDKPIEYIRNGILSGMSAAMSWIFSL